MPGPVEIYQMTLKQEISDVKGYLPNTIFCGSLQKTPPILWKNLILYLTIAVIRLECLSVLRQVSSTSIHANARVQDLQNPTEGSFHRGISPKPRRGYNAIEQ